MAVLRMVAALAPVAVLLGGIVGLKWRAYRAAALAWLVAVGGAAALFGAGPTLLAAASAKGLGLACVVLLIVWAAVFLYCLMHELGAMDAIGAGLLGSGVDPQLLPLLIGWAFAGFIQGIAGFGVPVTILTPLLVLAGLPPLQAVAVAMIGPTWAITFGSMGSSFFAIRLVMSLDGAVLGPTLALLSWLPILGTGLSVAHLAGGWNAVRRLWWLIALVSAAMTLTMWLLTVAGAAPLASMGAGVVGAGAIWLASGAVARRSRATVAADGRPTGIAWAFSPYLILAALSIATQLPVLKTATQPLRLALGYPAQATARGFEVAAIPTHAPLQLVGHPAPLLLLSALLTLGLFRRQDRWRPGVLGRAWRATVRQTMGTTIGVALMVMMALVVTDSGMAAAMAEGIAAMGRAAYLVSAPMLGMLGAFVTGSSTNSNVMFGPIQLYVSHALGLSPVLLAAAQTIGGAVGSGVAPDKALVGTSVSGADVREGDAIRRVLPYAALIVLAVGIETLLIGLVVRP